MSKNKEKQHLVVTIDGPAGVGKSTVARMLAKKLGAVFLDTGAGARIEAERALIQAGDGCFDRFRLLDLVVFCLLHQSGDRGAIAGFRPADFQPVRRYHPHRLQEPRRPSAMWKPGCSLRT